ncbi:lactadherin [Nematostella vectensis]|uniref:lactadherin n=1 Tax=Nematostella vectensis TaxID=45351 RepID=UPI0020779832|nr:lactadherin [Nematostella vectensis]
MWLVVLIFATPVSGICDSQSQKSVFLNKLEGKKLSANVSKSILVFDEFSCIRECFHLLGSCFSINFNKIKRKDGLYWCHLLDVKQQKDAAEVSDSEYVFIKIKTACDTTDCLNGGTCQLNYENSTAKCACLSDYTGNRCQINCTTALGMEDKGIPDSQISASSERTVYHAARFGRLHQEWAEGLTVGAWSPVSDQLGEYLQVDLMRATRITGVATQGRGGSYLFVRRYQLKHSLDGTSWNVYPKELVGNTEQYAVVRNFLSEVFTARFVRFCPTIWEHIICMRVEVYGCVEE